MNKSTQTRNHRQQFAKTYGTTTAQVVSYLARGWASDKVAAATGLPLRTVATYRANLTRGCYAPFVRGDRTNGFSGKCNF